MFYFTWEQIKGFLVACFAVIVVVCFFGWYFGISNGDCPQGMNYEPGLKSCIQASEYHCSMSGSWMDNCEKERVLFCKDNNNSEWYCPEVR